MGLVERGGICFLCVVGGEGRGREAGRGWWGLVISWSFARRGDLRPRSLRPCSGTVEVDVSMQKRMVVGSSISVD